MQKFLLQLPYSFSARYSDLFIRKIYFAMIFVLFFSFFALPIFALEDSGWKISYKEQAGWNTTDFDDSKWSSVKVPYSNYTNIKSAWFRRTIDMRENEIVSASLKLTALEIGSDVWSYGTPADKYYGYPPTTCWVNGRQVNSLSENTAPVAFMPGRNSIACRADSYNYVYTTKCWVGYYRPDCNSVENWLRFDFDVNVSLTYYQPDSLYFLCNEKIGCQIGGPKFDSMCEASCFPWGRKIDPSRYCSSNTINRCLFAWDNPVIRKYFIFNLIEPPKYMTPKNPNSKTPSNPLQYSQFKYISVHSTEPVKCFVDGSPLKLKQYGEPYWNLWAGLYAKPNELHIVECEIEHKSGDGNSVQKWSGPFFEWVWEPNYHEFDLEITDTAPIDISASSDGEAGAPLDIDVLLSSAGFHKAKLYSELWTNLTNGTAIRVDAAEMDVNFTNKISENFILQPLLWRDHKNYTLIVSAVDSLNRTFQKHFPVVLKENQLPELENFSINGSSCKLKRESCSTSCAAYETDSWQCPTGKIICNHVNWGNVVDVYKAPNCKIEYPSQFQYEYPAYPESLYPYEGEIKKAKDAGCAPELVRGGSTWFCDGWYAEWKTCSEPRCISQNITCEYTAECDGAGDINMIVSNITHVGNEDTVVYVTDAENKLITSLPEGDHNLKIEVKDKIDNDNAFFNILLNIMSASASGGAIIPFVLAGGDGEKISNQEIPLNTTPIIASALALAGVGGAGYFVIRRNARVNLKQRHSSGIGDQHALMVAHLAVQKSRAAKIAFDIQEEDRRRGWEEAQAWNAAKKFQEREQEKILDTKKKFEGLQYALANADRMHTYEQKAKELARIQKDYSDVLSSEGKAALASQASRFTNESERLYASYKETKALQISAAQRTIGTSNNSEKTEQDYSLKKPAPPQEMKLPIKINKINYGNANEKIDKWVVENSEGLKKMSDTLGWASLGMFIAGAALTATGFGAVAGVPLMAAAFGSQAIGGGLDLAVGSTRQKAGLANEDDYWRMGFAPLAFIPGFGGAKQALKQIGKQAGKILGSLTKPLAELAGNSGKIGAVADKAKDIFTAGKKIITESIDAVRNAVQDFGGKIKNSAKNIFKGGRNAKVNNNIVGAAMNKVKDIFAVGNGIEKESVNIKNIMKDVDDAEKRISFYLKMHSKVPDHKHNIIKPVSALNNKNLLLRNSVRAEVGRDAKGKANTLKLQVENYEHFNVMMKNLHKHGISTDKNNFFLLSRGHAAEFAWSPPKVTYGDFTKVGDFMHELRHFAQYRAIGKNYMDRLNMAPLLEQKIVKSILEFDAYRWEMRSAEVFGYNRDEINLIKDQIKQNHAFLSLTLNKIPMAQRANVLNVVSKLETDLKTKLISRKPLDINLVGIKSTGKFSINRAEADKILPLLAFLKAKNADKSIVNTVDEIIKKLPRQYKSWFDGIFFRMREEMMA